MGVRVSASLCLQAVLYMMLKYSWKYSYFCEWAYVITMTVLKMGVGGEFPLMPSCFMAHMLLTQSSISAS